MDNDEAIKICKQWFAYLDRQKEKSARLQELAALAIIIFVATVLSCLERTSVS